MEPLRITDEQWRPIPGMPGYEASDLGRIRSLDRMCAKKRGPPQFFPGKIKALCALKSGYLFFSTTRKTHLVSRAVLLAFVGEPPTSNMQACHCSGDKSDNRRVNLRWDTPKGNNADKHKHGTHGAGETHSQAKLSAEQVAAIRLDKRSERVIGAAYGISSSHAGHIRRGDYWKAVA